MTLSSQHPGMECCGEGDLAGAPALNPGHAVFVLLRELERHCERVAELAGMSSVQQATRQNATYSIGRGRHLTARVKIKDLIRDESLAALAAIREVLEKQA